MKLSRENLQLRQALGKGSNGFEKLLHAVHFFQGFENKMDPKKHPYLWLECEIYIVNQRKVEAEHTIGLFQEDASDIGNNYAVSINIEGVQIIP